MKIIIQFHPIKESHFFINDIYKKHSDKIKDYKKDEREIVLINGDAIKIVGTERIDGLRADAAIGPCAGILTCRSSYKKRIWDFDDLEKHIRRIK